MSVIHPNVRSLSDFITQNKSFLPRPHKITELQSNWTENMMGSSNRNEKEEKKNSNSN